MTYYVDCPSCAKLRPWAKRPELVVKGEKKCRYCGTRVIRKIRRKNPRIA
jgi:endogenous inhibitor of DNA gyrase (YacG/DUF329 family)